MEALEPWQRRAWFGMISKVFCFTEMNCSLGVCFSVVLADLIGVIGV